MALLLNKHSIKPTEILDMMTKDQEFIRRIKENKGIIYKICNSYCAYKDDRDDLAQEIIYNLWKSFGSFNDAFKFLLHLRVPIFTGDVPAGKFYKQNKSGGRTCRTTEIICNLYDESTMPMLCETCSFAALFFRRRRILNRIIDRLGVSVILYQASFTSWLVFLPTNNTNNRETKNKINTEPCKD